MAIIVTWYPDHKNIVYVRFETAWNWDDFYTMNEDFNALANSVSEPIAALIDVSHTSMPANFIAQLPKIASISNSERPTNLDLTVVVGLRGIIETAVSIFSRVYRQAASHLLMASNVEEGLATIVAHQDKGFELEKQAE